MRASLRHAGFRLHAGLAVGATPETDHGSEFPTTRALASKRGGNPKVHLREGAIYSDHSNNIIQLLSINSDYCAYTYLTSRTQRPEMHGLVTGLTRRNVFESGFIFIAENVDEWKWNLNNGSNRLKAFPKPPSLESIDFASLCQPQRRRA
jgi:hypothetical protein